MFSEIFHEISLTFVKKRSKKDLRICQDLSIIEICLCFWVSQRSSILCWYREIVGNRCWGTQNSFPTVRSGGIWLTTWWSQRRLWTNRFHNFGTCEVKAVSRHQPTTQNLPPTMNSMGWETKNHVIQMGFSGWGCCCQVKEGKMMNSQTGQCCLANNRKVPQII